MDSRESAVDVLSRIHRGDFRSIGDDVFNGACELAVDEFGLLKPGASDDEKYRYLRSLVKLRDGYLSRH